MLVNSINDKLTEVMDHSHIYHLIAQYTARVIDRSTFYESVKKLDLRSRRQLKEWRRWADGSFYYHRLWRVVIKGTEPSTYSVDEEDVIWVLDHLTRRDKNILKVLRERKLVPTKRFKSKVFNVLIKDLKKFTDKLIKYKCWFICKYDAGVTLEDLTAEVLEHAIVAVLRYEPLYNSRKVLGYAKKAAHNRTINLIKEHTAGKRARVVNEGSQQNEYRSTVISIDGCYDVTRMVSNYGSLNQMLSKLEFTNPSYSNLACAILGLCPYFDHWAKTWAKKDTSKISATELGELARKWLGLQDVDNSLKELLL